MSFASPLHRTLLIALASLALAAPAAQARLPEDLRSEAPTSSLSGTSHQTSPEMIPGRVLRRSFDPYPEPFSHLGAALAQERSYSTYGEPAAMPIAATDAGDGIAWLPFLLAVAGALVVGLGAGCGLHLVHVRRQGTRLAT